MIKIVLAAMFALAACGVDSPAPAPTVEPSSSATVQQSVADETEADVGPSIEDLNLDGTHPYTCSWTTCTVRTDCCNWGRYQCLAGHCYPF